MGTLQSAQQKELNDLRASYCRRLPDRIDAIQEAAESAMTLLRAGAPAAPRQAVEPLFQLSHRLAGSSSTLGFPAVAEAARRLEGLVESIAENRTTTSDGRLEIIKLLDEIKRASKKVAARPPATSSTALRGKPSTAPSTGKTASPRRKGAGAAAEGVRPKATVLLVDDDEDALAVEAFQLRGKDLRIDTATSGNEALGKITAQPPDLVIADVKMEGMSGYELCRLVRGMGHDDLPFIFLSALGAAPQRIMGLRMGADDYMVKPINAEELLLKVRRQLAKNRRLRALQKSDR